MDSECSCGTGSVTVTVEEEILSPITPFNDQVLVEVLPEGSTKGGILLPDGTNVSMPRGRVVAVGPGRNSEFDGKFIPMQVKVGDIVSLYVDVRLGPPMEVNLQGRKFFCVRQGALAGKINEQVLANEAAIADTVALEPPGVRLYQPPVEAD